MTPGNQKNTYRMLRNCCGSFARIRRQGPIRQDQRSPINRGRIEIEIRRQLVRGRIKTGPQPHRSRRRNSLLSTLFLLRLFSLQSIQFIQGLKTTLNHSSTLFTQQALLFMQSKDFGYGCLRSRYRHLFPLIQTLTHPI